MYYPKAVNLQTPEQVRAQGWQAEARDEDGHLISTLAPFSGRHAVLQEFVEEYLKEGFTVTVWPMQN